MPVLGIEPAANVAAAAIERGIPTRVEFFGAELGDSLREGGGAADLIVGNNVLAHVPDPHDLVEGMARLLKPTGVVTMEFPHLLRLISGRQLDTIYHEHFSYFSLFTAPSAVRRARAAAVRRRGDPDPRRLAPHLRRARRSHRGESERLRAVRAAEDAAGLSSLTATSASRTNAGRSSGACSPSSSRPGSRGSGSRGTAHPRRRRRSSTTAASAAT